MYDREEIKDRIINILSTQLGLPKSEIEENNLLIEDLGADSLDSVEIIMGLEDEFKVEISDEDAKDILTVGDIITYMEKALAD